MFAEPGSLLGSLQDMKQGDWDALSDSLIAKLSLDAHGLISAWGEVAERIDLEIARRNAIKVHSGSESGTVYEVWFEPHPHCTCMGFRYRGTCKHLAQAREVSPG